MQYKLSNLNCPHLLKISRSELKSAYHQPHFSESFFVFVSVRLLEQQLFGWESACIRQMHISEESRWFWRDLRRAQSSRPTWVAELVGIMRGSLGEFVTSDSDVYAGDVLPTSHFTAHTPWFLHASDAVWLTSQLLRLDTCAYYNSLRLYSGNTPLNVSILQRRGARVLLNMYAVRQATQRYFVAINTSSRVGTIEFEPLSIVEQAQRMLETDVLITLHGAGETNMAFMKPCSIGTVSVGFRSHAFCQVIYCT
jgi:hypothetical protein